MWKQFHKVSFKTVRFCKQCYKITELQLLLQAMFFSRYMMRNVMARSFSFSSVTDSLQPHGLQHTRLPWPSPTPRACSNWCPLSQWCHPTISSSVIPFSSCLQSFPTWGSFPMSQFFPSGSQSIGVSASSSVFPMNIQDWFPLGLTGLTSLQYKGLSFIYIYIF